MDETLSPSTIHDFDVLKQVGKGAYGIVWKAIDKKTREVVAIKKVY